MSLVRKDCLFLCQTGIYKLSLTKISHSKFPISVPTQQRLFSPNMTSLLPSHLFKLPSSPVLCIRSIRCHTSCSPGLATMWPPHQKSEGPYQLQGDMELEIITCFRVFHVPFFDRAEASCSVSAFLSSLITPPTENTIGVKWYRLARQASRYIPFFLLMLR